MIAVELSRDMDAKLESIVARTGRSKADHVHEALSEYLKSWDEELLSDGTMNALREAEEDITAGRTMSLQDFRRGLGL